MQAQERSSQSRRAFWVAEATPGGGLLMVRRNGLRDTALPLPPT